MNEKQSTLFPNTPNTAKTSDTSGTLNVLQGLDRDEVMSLARKILKEITPWCASAEVVGSFRREKPVINDLDIVVQPQQSMGCWLEILRSVRYEFDAVTDKQGNELATFYLPFVSKQGQGHVQVELYRARSSTWGVLLLVRTGSKEHNVKLCSLAHEKGMMLSAKEGVIKDGKVIASRTEEEIFAALGFAYVEPRDREV